MALAGQATNLTVDAGVAGTQVSLMDVDKQPSTALLAELATSVDGVLWSAVHATTGQYLRIEDTGARPPLMVLAKDPADGLVKIVPDPAAAGSVPISACDVLLDPVRWVQDVADVSTRVQVRWLEQTTADGKPATVEHTETAEDPTLIATLGVRRIGVSTVLTGQPDGKLLAERILARTADRGWRVAGLLWSTGLEPLDPDAVERALTLLDGTTRLGCPIVLTDLPEWAPSGDTVPLFLEGGTYTFDDGAWSLDMIVSAATGQGGSVTWGQLDPSWRWQDIDPSIRWGDLRGVSGPHATTERTPDA